LRPLGFGTLIGAPFQVLRRNPKATFGSAVLVQAIVMLVSIVVVGAVTAFAIARISMADASNVDAVSTGSVAAILLSALIPVAFGLLASAWLQGVIVTEVAHATLGEKLRMRALWRGIVGRRAALIGWTALEATAMVVALAIVAAAVTGLVLLGPGGIIAGVLIGILGTIGLAVLWFWLATKLSLVPSAIVLERASVRNAITRSWALTDRFFWRTLGVQFLVGTICAVAAQIVTLPFSILFPILSALIAPTGAQSNATMVVVMIVIYVAQLLVSLVVGGITSVVQSAATALIYLDLRMRKEGLDLTLIRFVEARQAGQPIESNPFTTPRFDPQAAV
jgi:Membrane domain of glycerophosphoryl diester phosphodiesterase.